jgi:hypothetical protein
MHSRYGPEVVLELHEQRMRTCKVTDEELRDRLHRYEWRINR